SRVRAHVLRGGGPRRHPAVPGPTHQTVHEGTRTGRGHVHPPGLLARAGGGDRSILREQQARAIIGGELRRAGRRTPLAGQRRPRRHPSQPEPVTRLRETGWAIALWGVLVLILGLTSNDSGPICVSPAVCDPVTIALVVAAVLGVGWLFGSLVLLATHPRGAARAFLVQVMVNVLALGAALVLLSLVRLP